MRTIVAMACTIGILIAISPGASAQMVDQHQFEDVKQHPSCSYCGMDRQQFSRSRMLIRYDDGSSMAACSMHCAALDLALMIDKNPRSIQVADYPSGRLIDAETAVWVVGGSRPGVMTQRAKWAFEKKPDAEAFLKQYGGQLAGFDEAMRATFDDMYSDTKMIRERRKMRPKMPGAPAPMASHSHN